MCSASAPNLPAVQTASAPAKPIKTATKLRETEDIEARRTERPNVSDLLTALRIPLNVPRGTGGIGV